MLSYSDLSTPLGIKSHLDNRVHLKQNSLDSVVPSCKWPFSRKVCEYLMTADNTWQIINHKNETTKSCQNSLFSSVLILMHFYVAVLTIIY